MPLLTRPLSWSPSERWDVCRAWPVVLSVRLALWLIPYRRLERLVLQRPLGSATSVLPAQVGLAVRRASRVVPRASCLVQSLAAGWLLRKAGHTPQLQIGVRGGTQDFAAHAWLECDGQVVVGGEIKDDYLAFERD
jgi:hypothetical protein